MNSSWINKNKKRNSQQEFKNSGHDLSTVKLNKIALRNNYDKRIQIFNLVKTFAYQTLEEIRHKTKRIMMTNFDDITKKYYSLIPKLASDFISPLDNTIMVQDQEKLLLY